MAKIAVLIPCYNESVTVAKVVSDFKTALPEADIYVYDNNSTDGTDEIARAAGAIVKYEYRQGKGNVIRSMFRDIDADCYLMIDGDDTYPAEHAREMCDLVLEKGVDMVIGDRLSSTYFTENKRPFHNVGNKSVRFLINNAGLAKMVSYKDFSLDEISRTIDVNCKAPVLLCNICIPYMKSGSNILNISSASAFQPNPYINLYAASKAFERNYSRALNVELEGTGITVTAVCPGWVDTEMLVKEMNGKKVKLPGMVKAERVVKTALRDAKKGRDMSVCSLYVKCQHLNVKMMPQRLVMKI